MIMCKFAGMLQICSFVQLVGLEGVACLLTKLFGCRKHICMLGPYWDVPPQMLMGDLERFWLAEALQTLRT